ncbi:MAG: DNA-3-methyladenine glycosylase 2 family protein [Pseudomonadota bacterium]
MKQPTTIATAAHVKQAVAYLKTRCTTMCHVHEIAGDPPLRRYASGFKGLARIVVGQQLSIASAKAIYGRLQDICPDLQPETFLATSTESLKKAGLSRAKIETLRNLAKAVLHDTMSLTKPPEDALETFRASLLQQKGIGPWTVDIYEMFCLGRADAFAPGDMALQEAARRAFTLESRPTSTELLEIANRWRPQRTVAACLLWSYYATDRRKPLS